MDQQTKTHKYLVKALVLSLWLEKLAKKVLSRVIVQAATLSALFILLGLSVFGAPGHNIASYVLTWIVLLVQAFVLVLLVRIALNEMNY